MQLVFRRTFDHHPDRHLALLGQRSSARSAHQRQQDLLVDASGLHRPRWIWQMLYMFKFSVIRWHGRAFARLLVLGWCRPTLDHTAVVGQLLANCSGNSCALPYIVAFTSASHGWFGKPGGLQVQRDADWLVRLTVNPGLLSPFCFWYLSIQGSPLPWTQQHVSAGRIIMVY